MDIPNPLSPPLPIVLYFRQVLRTELLYVGSSWSSCLCMSMRRGPQEYITYALVLTSPAVSCMSGSSNFDIFRDGWSVAVQLLLCWVLSPGLVQYCQFFTDLDYSNKLDLLKLFAVVNIYRVQSSSNPKLLAINQTKLRLVINNGTW